MARRGVRTGRMQKYRLANPNRLAGKAIPPKFRPPPTDTTETDALARYKTANWFFHTSPGFFSDTEDDMDFNLKKGQQLALDALSPHVRPLAKVAFQSCEGKRPDQINAIVQARRAVEEDLRMIASVVNNEPLSRTVHAFKTGRLKRKGHGATDNS